jgi:4-hydroxy-tetrahydrodipicolinate synthase
MAVVARSDSQGANSNLTGLPKLNCLMAAVATPVTAEFRPAPQLLLERCQGLMRDGCDGIVLFGTTGEGAEIATVDRKEALEAVLAGGLDPARLIVSVGALAISDVVGLARHALDHGVEGLLLMPPCVYRGGVTEEGTFQFYAGVIDQAARTDMRLYLYHFPDISGVPVTPRVIRRLEERYPGTVVGIKDSGGSFDFTEGLLRRFSHLAVYTGTELHVPQALAGGARGTICGLANAMPRLLRAMMDQGTGFERRRFLPQILAGDNILSRGPFIASLKVLIAEATGNPAWRRVLPPMALPSLAEEQRLISDFRRWESCLPASLHSLFRIESQSEAKIVPLRRG